MRTIVCITIITLFITFAGFTLVSAAPQRPKIEKDWPKTYAIGAGTGGVYYAIAGGITAITEKYVGVAGIPSKTSGAEETARLIHKGDMQLGFMTPDVAYESVRGLGTFKRTGPLKIRAILQDFPLGFDITTLANKGIISPSDFKGKAGFTLARGSAIMRIFLNETLAAYALKPEDLKASLVFDTHDEAMEALVVGKVDFFINCAPHPAAKWTELSATHPMKIINIDDNHMKKMIQNVPYMFSMKIPGNMYKTMPEDIQVSAFSSIVVGGAELSESFVYELTKAIWTNFEEFKTYHAGAKYFSKEAVKRVSYIPYHPGAIKYYKETGIWTKELDDRQAKLLAEVSAAKK